MMLKLSECSKGLYSQLESRFLQTIAPTCLVNQYVNKTNYCTNCPSACATCVAPSGSCEKCINVFPTVNYAQVTGNNATNLAICGLNSFGCVYRDPYCIGVCGNAVNGGKCQTCLKGTTLTTVTSA